ncbi:GFA family protein [Devosia sp. CAU 1758]
MSQQYSGRCLCGEISYVAHGKPLIVAQCHCEECRRISGTGHTIGAMFPKEAVEIFGDLKTFRYLSGKDSEVTKAFCNSCGSPVFGTNTRSPEHLTLSLGTMDDAKGLSVEVVIFERDKQHWDHLQSDVVLFNTQPDWTPAA